MRGNCKLSNVALILSLALLVFQYGHLSARPQTDRQIRPDPTPTPTPTPPPQIRIRLSPTSGPQNGGNRVTITGAGFNEQTTVTFGNLPAEVIKPVQPKTITVIVPNQGKAGRVSVTVSTPGKRVLRARYQYNIPSPGNIPTDSTLAITKIDPSSVFSNALANVAIHGRNFTPKTEVKIEGQRFVPELEGSGVLKIVIPPDTFGPGAVDVTVWNRDSDNISTMENGFTFMGPKIFWIEPSRGAAKGGEQVRIYGRHLKHRNLADVLFGDIPITGGKPSDDEHTLYVDTPPHQPGWVDVVVYNAVGQRTVLPKAYYYESPKDPAAAPTKYSRVHFVLAHISVEKDGNANRGNSWSFDVRVNSKRLCNLEPRMYFPGLVTAERDREGICAQEIGIEENELKIRIIGIRGSVWMEGETTVPLEAIMNREFTQNPLNIHVRANNGERKGHFVFFFRMYRF